MLEEAGLNELKEAECRWAIQLEKCLRQKDGDPRRALATETVTQRLKSEGWRRRATAISREKIGEDVSRCCFPEVRPPWTRRVQMAIRSEGTKGPDKERN